MPRQITLLTRKDCYFELNIDIMRKTKFKEVGKEKTQLPGIVKKSDGDF